MQKLMLVSNDEKVQKNQKLMDSESKKRMAKE
jgi:hypothetical protein